LQATVTLHPARESILAPIFWLNGLSSTNSAFTPRRASALLARASPEVVNGVVDCVESVMGSSSVSVVVALALTEQSGERT
jgi:hypothetical protein